MYLPFILTACIVAADQIVKMLIVQNIGMHEIGFVAGDGFFRLVHTRNLGIAFSIGREWSPTVRRVLFIVFPAVVMIFVLIYYFKGEDLTTGMRWAMAGILGGGTGNIIDRIIRSEGVVDFLDFKFYGIFGLERWPVFNLADMSVVVSALVLLLLFIIQERRNRE